MPLAQHTEERPAKRAAPKRRTFSDDDALVKFQLFLTAHEHRALTNVARNAELPIAAVVRLAVRRLLDGLGVAVGDVNLASEILRRANGGTTEE